VTLPPALPLATAVTLIQVAWLTADQAQPAVSAHVYKNYWVDNCIVRFVSVPQLPE